MTSAQSMRRFGTVLFGYGALEELIYFDADVKTLECGLWLSLVPEAYRDAAMAAAQRAFKPFVGLPMRNSRLVDEFLLALSFELEQLERRASHLG